MKLPSPATALLAVALGATAVAVEGPNPYLGQAKVFYQGLEYEKCLQRLSVAHRWSSTPEEAVEIELYGGLCNYNLGKEQRAVERFGAALQLDPQAQLPGMTSPKIVELFRSVASKAERKAAAEGGAEARAAPKEREDVADAPRRKDPPAEAEPSRLTPAGPDERPVVVIPVETGTSRKPSLLAPLVLGGVAVAGGGIGAFFGIQAKSFEAQANEAVFASDAASFANAARRDAVVANVSYAVAAGAAVSALVSYLIITAASDR